jgi:hypothetical protein
MRLLRRDQPGWLIIVLLLCPLLSPLGRARQDSQNPTPAPSEEPAKSLAEVAKETRTSKAAKAKKVVTDEDVDGLKGPLPRLNLEGPDNSEAIVKAIAEYRAQHTPEQTETAVHDWYDNYDAMLAGAIRDMIDTRALRESTTYSGNQLCQEQNADYEQCQKRRQTEMRGAHHDQQVTREDGALSSRIQLAFIRVRTGMGRSGLRYDWFKIRNANGIGSF